MANVFVLFVDQTNSDVLTARVSLEDSVESRWHTTYRDKSEQTHQRIAPWLDDLEVMAYRDTRQPWNAGASNSLVQFGHCWADRV